MASAKKKVKRLKKVRSELVTASNGAWEGVKSEAYNAVAAAGEEIHRTVNSKEFKREATFVRRTVEDSAVVVAATAVSEAKRIVSTLIDRWF